MTSGPNSVYVTVMELPGDTKNKHSMAAIKAKHRSANPKELDRHSSVDTKNLDKHNSAIVKHKSATPKVKNRSAITKDSIKRNSTIKKVKHRLATTKELVKHNSTTIKNLDEHTWATTKDFVKDTSAITELVKHSPTTEDFSNHSLVTPIYSDKQSSATTEDLVNQNFTFAIKIQNSSSTKHLDKGSVTLAIGMHGIESTHGEDREVFVGLYSITMEYEQIVRVWQGIKEVGETLARVSRALHWMWSLSWKVAESIAPPIEESKTKRGHTPRRSRIRSVMKTVGFTVLVGYLIIA